MGIAYFPGGGMRFTEPWQDATRAGNVNSLAHLRNAYIEKVDLHSGAERCVPLLSGVSDALNFKVGRLNFEENLQETETLERSVDWIVRDLRVASYELLLCDDKGDDHMLARLPTILTHRSVRDTAEYLCAKVSLRRMIAKVFFEPGLPPQPQLRHEKSQSKPRSFS